MTHAIPSLRFSSISYFPSSLGLSPSRLDRVRDLCRGIQSHENKEISQESGDACKSGFPKGFDELVGHIMRRPSRELVHDCPDHPASYAEAQGSDTKGAHQDK